MSQLISARLPDKTAERVRQVAKRRQRSINEMVSLAVEEWLRQNEFALIEFRDTRDGRAAFMKDSRLPVWWVIKVAKAEGLEIEKVHRYWPNRPREWVQAALNYYAAYPEEIGAQIADHAAMTAEQMQRRFPQMETFVVPADVRGEPPREPE
jgi:uncharacterized protein (DUF433 family)